MMQTIPQEIVDKVVAAAHQHYPGDEAVDLRGYVGISGINKQFMDTYLRFFTRLPKVVYREKKPKELHFHRRLSRAPLQAPPAEGEEERNGFTGPYIVEPGMVRKLAACGKLDSVKEVQLYVTPERCTKAFAAAVKDGDCSPLSFLTHLLGIKVVESNSENCGNSGGGMGGNGKGELLILDRATITLIGDDADDAPREEGKNDEIAKINIAAVLGLDAYFFQLSFVIPTLATPLPFEVPEMAYFDNISCMDLCVIVPLSCEEKQEEYITEFTFPSREWTTLIECLASACGWLRMTVMTRLAVCPHNPEHINTELERCRAVVLECERMLSEPAIKESSLSLWFDLEFGLLYDGILPVATHPIFQLGRLGLEENNEHGDPIAITREIIVQESAAAAAADMEDESASEEGDEKPGRKRLTWCIMAL